MGVLPGRGSWLQTRGPGTSTCCKAYSALPPGGSYLYTFDKSIYFGPVHEVYTCAIDYVKYIAVMVPSIFDMEVLVSVNIWSSHDQHQRAVLGGVMFATLVSWQELESWYASGWEDHWVSGSDAYHWARRRMSRKVPRIV